MEEMGLAAQSAQQAQPSTEEMVQQVMQALMEGMSPEELLQQGVPAEVIQMAIQMLQQQQSAGKAPVPVEQQGGLAAASIPMM